MLGFQNNIYSEISYILFFYVARFLTYRESDYDTPDHIKPMEKRGVQGDSILVNGIRTGSAVVQAQLKDPVYKVR